MNASTNNDIDASVELKRARRRVVLMKYYHKKMNDPVFAEDCRVKALARYYAKKQKQIDAGIVKEPVGRPRKFKVSSSL
jgi:hypothetical protein